jgi:flagellar biogenesis protein FliO
MAQEQTLLIDKHRWLHWTIALGFLIALIGAMGWIVTR